MDSFQGCYKDGTEPGTRDCRWFASLFLAIRFLQFITGAYTLGVLFYTYSTIIVVTTCILLISIQPFKKPLRLHSYINAMFLLLLALWNTTAVANVQLHQTKITIVYHVLLGMLGTIPVFYITGLILVWMYRNRRFGLEFLQRLQCFRRGYEVLN